MKSQFEVLRMIMRMNAKRLGLTITEKSILHAIVDRLDENAICFPSQQVLADSVGCSVRAVSVGITKMCKLDYVAKKARVVNGTKLGNYLMVNITKIAEVGGMTNVVQVDFRRVS